MMSRYNAQTMKEAGSQLVLGSGAIAYLQLAEVQMITSILVGLVTCVCLIYTTFVRRRKR